MGQASSRGSHEQPQSDRRRRRSALIRLPSTSTLVSTGVESEAPLATSSLSRRTSRFVRPADLFHRRRQRSSDRLRRSSTSLLNNPPASEASTSSRPLSPQTATESPNPTMFSSSPLRHDLPRGSNVAQIEPGSQLDSVVSARQASIRNLGSRLRQSLPQTTLRRRSSSMQRGDDHTAMLSRLLSAAAMHTAASIIGEDAGSSLRLRNDDNGAFDNFLESLQNGSLHNALRQSVAGEDGQTDGEGRRTNQLNFFRMFRLGTVDGPASRNTDTTRQITERGDENDNDGRLVPIIIVGIRSINAGNADDTGFPPFIDALSNLPATVSPTDTPFDNFLPAGRNNASFSHRRRASMGGLANLQAAQESQRAQPVADRARPFSATSESLIGARPPPSTPASAGLSTYPSGATTPTQTPSSRTPLPTVPNLLPRPRPQPRPEFPYLDSANTEDSELQRRNNARRRRRSDSNIGRYGSGSSRRNGVVGLDSADDLQEEAQRSWIIYVLGGSYPADHPILSTPSLFSDSPTYEDMLLLSSLIGPAKPPVASEADVARAPGLFRVRRMTNEDGESQLIATGLNAPGGFFAIGSAERCLVCLSEFEDDDLLRQLIKCRHLFHKDCIDQWLTTGRNSCPLCREEGVEKSSETSTPTETPAEEPPSAFTSAYPDDT